MPRRHRQSGPDPGTSRSQRGRSCPSRSLGITCSLGSNNYGQFSRRRLVQKINPVQHAKAN
jgi:hypothetical protein